MTWTRPTAPTVHTDRPTIVILGMMAKMPVAGVAWQTLHYLEGFRRLGFRVWYVEAHASTPRAHIQGPGDDGARRAAAYLERTLARVGWGHDWAYQARHSDGRFYGRARREVERAYASAALIINLHGGTTPLPEHGATGRLAFLGTDPVQLEIELFHGNLNTVEFLAQHQLHFSFGENYGHDDCALPVTDGWLPIPTRQPVVMDFWEGTAPPPAASFTTVGNWRQEVRDLRYRAETYTWSKHHEFLKLIDLPQRTHASLELALSSIAPEERALLQAHGWAVRDALKLSAEVDPYRAYVQGSAGEFTVAKDQNVRFRTGWFSDRSSCYLAAGRPVVTQDTGFGRVLPTDAGLLAFTTQEEAAEALDRVVADPDRHARAATRIARECFAHDVVLSRLLEDGGVPLPRRARSAVSAASWPGTSAIPTDLILMPVSHHPVILAEETLREVMDHGFTVPPTPARSGQPRVSVIVVTHEQEVFTRLCLTALLASTTGDDVEILVVDNGSTDGTVKWLTQLIERHPQVRLLRNRENVGFAAANNRGLAAARGQVFVLLNNDTVVAPGWLQRLEAHLDTEDVGAVGPVTNRIGNEARIEVPYRTYGEFLAFAAERAAELDRRAFEIPTLTMFCFAFRRAVWERVGSLDERFGLGTLEDDDYSARLAQIGLKRVCAEDVVVHHFGRASFGSMVPTGAYHALLTENQKRFAEKWGRAWQPYRTRPSSEYDSLVERVRSAVVAHVPEDGAVAVVTRGDHALLELGQRRSAHLPADESGAWTGFHPATAADAIRAVEAFRQGGGGYLVVPHPSAWWLDYYRGLRVWLQHHHRMVVQEPDVCTVFELLAEDEDARIAGGAR